jgi:putative DNA primase/helicase
MSFLQLAEPFLALNIPVFPLVAGEKRPITINGCKDATINLDQVIAWDTEYPGCNIGIAALSGGDFCFLEFDQKGIKDAATEMNADIPKTRVQKSGNGGAHFMFKHTDRSRKIGNRSANLNGHEWFSFRADNLYLVGAGSLHPNGNLYETVKDVEPLPVPDWVCEFVERHSTAPAPKPTGTLSVDEEFDFDDLTEFFDISIAGVKDDVWHIVEECPGVGHRHEGSTLTAFYWDGDGLGWSCFAQGCPLHGKSIGQVIKFLNQQKGESYKGVIWPQDDSKLFDVDSVDDETIPDFEDRTGVSTTVTPSYEPAEVTNKSAADDREELADNAGKAKAFHEKMQALRDEEKQLEEEADEPEPETKDPVDPTWHYAGFCKVNEDNSLGLLVKNASDYIMEELEWLWPQRIPKKKVTLFTGKPDCGKSVALLDLIACITTGRDFPDGEKNILPPSKVLLAATEDDPADTLIPRLVAAGTDIKKVKIVLGTVVVGKNKKGSLTKKKMNLNIKRDAKVLIEAIKDNPDIALLALDPITGFFGDADVNKDKDIRPVLEELGRVLNKSGITCVGIIHSSKRSDVDAIHKVSGAGALAAVVRAVWGFSRDSEDKKLYHMAFVKGNLGKVKGGINYALQGTPVCINNKDVDTVHIVWGEQTEEDADDLLRAERSNKDGGDTKMLIATALIRSMIPAKASDIFKKGLDEGISDQTIRRARYKIDKLVARQRQGAWWWFLDGDGPMSSAAEKSMADVMSEKEIASIM